MIKENGLDGLFSKIAENFPDWVKEITIHVQKTRLFLNRHEQKNFNRAILYPRFEQWNIKTLKCTPGEMSDYLSGSLIKVTTDFSSQIPQARTKGRDTVQVLNNKNKPNQTKVFNP